MFPKALTNKNGGIQFDQGIEPAPVARNEGLLIEQPFVHTGGDLI